MNIIKIEFLKEALIDFIEDRKILDIISDRKFYESRNRKVGQIHLRGAYSSKQIKTHCTMLPDNIHELFPNYELTKGVRNFELSSNMEDDELTIFKLTNQILPDYVIQIRTV